MEKARSNNETGEHGTEIISDRVVLVLVCKLRLPVASYVAS